MKSEKEIENLKKGNTIISFITCSISHTQKSNYSIYIRDQNTWRRQLSSLLHPPSKFTTYPKSPTHNSQLFNNVHELHTRKCLAQKRLLEKPIQCHYNQNIDRNLTTPTLQRVASGFNPSSAFGPCIFSVVSNTIHHCIENNRIVKGGQARDASHLVCRQNY